MSRGVTVAAAGVVAAIIVLLLLWGPPTLSVERLRETLLSYGPWAVLISSFLMIGQAIIAPLPSNVIIITNALVFGPLWGGLLSWTTTLIASSLCFALSKGLGKPFALRIVGHSLEKAERFFKRYGLYAVFVVRIMPFVPFDAVSYAAGLVGVPYSRFLLATAVGTIPSIIIYSYVGSAFASSYVWILAVGLGLSVIMLSLSPRIWRKAQLLIPTPVTEAERTAH